MIRPRARAVRLAAAPPGLADGAGTEVARPGQPRVQLRALLFQLVKRLLGHPGSPLEVLTLPDYLTSLELPGIPTYVSRTQHELAAYGMSVLRGWMHSGYVFKLAAGRGFAMYPTEAELEELFRDSDTRARSWP